MKFISSTAATITTLYLDFISRHITNWLSIEGHHVLDLQGNHYTRLILNTWQPHSDQTETKMILQNVFKHLHTTLIVGNHVLMV